MKQSGFADLPLHYGHVPAWLYERMAKLGLAIVEEILASQGKDALLARFSNPFWFQSLGAVMGMDWHSSGITTSVMGALKRAINPYTKEFGIQFCGGKGNASKSAPQEITLFAQRYGLDASQLVLSSKLSAKIDSVAMQDGFQLYQHHFIVNDIGHWAVIQQGMSDRNATARRYHWHSENMVSFSEKPHAFIYGENQGRILNLTALEAKSAKTAMLEIIKEKPQQMLCEISKLVMPKHHDVRAKDVDLKRLGAMLYLAHDTDISNFEELLLLKDVGPRTLQSLALVSEVIYGQPSRFTDPARFSFAHGGKDGHPFPVPLKIYDETISTLQRAINQAKIGNSDKIQAINSLSKVAQCLEKDFEPNQNFADVIAMERAKSHQYGGRTVFGKVPAPTQQQLSLF